MKALNLLISKIVVCATLVLLFTNSLFAQQFDVALSKTTVTEIPVKYGTSIPFNITLYNQGTDTITNVSVIEHFGTGYEYQQTGNDIWTPHPTITNAATATYLLPIPPDENRIITINLIARPGDSREAWINTAEVTGFTDMMGIPREGEDGDSVADEDPNNDAGGLLGSPADDHIDGDGTGAINSGLAAGDEDDHDRDTVRIFDLALKKVLDPIVGYKYEDTLTFNTTIYNQGNVKATFVVFKELKPEGYINPVAENQAIGWSSDIATPTFQIDELNTGDSITVPIKLILDNFMINADAWHNYSEIVSARDGLFANMTSFDADSDYNSNTPEERSVKEGDPDDNYLGNNPSNPGYQDDHDPAEPEIFDLAIIKMRATADPSFTYGTPITYSYELQNQGNLDATNIVIVDSLPCGAYFDQDANPDWSYDMNSNIVTKTIPGPLAGGEIDEGFLILTVVQCYEDQETAWLNIMEISQATNKYGVQFEEIDGSFDSNFSNDPGAVADSPTDDQLDGIGIIDEDNHDVELLQVYDLALKKELITEGPYEEGQILDFRIRVYNQGNVFIEDLVVEDFIADGLHYDPVINEPLGWTNTFSAIVFGVPTIFPDTLNVMEDVNLEAGDSVDIIIKLQLEFDGESIEDYYNYAHIFTATDSVGNNRFDDADSNPFTPNSLEFAVLPGSEFDDNLTSLGKALDPEIEEDDHDVAVIEFFDLSLEKEVTSNVIEYGQPITFDIKVKNESTQFAHDITIVDYLTCGFSFNLGDNQGWSVDPISGNPTYFYTDTLFTGDSIIVPISLILVECNDPDPNTYSNQAEISNAADFTGNPGDDQDSDPDDDPDNDPPGEDDTDMAPIEIFDLTLQKTLTNTITNVTIGTPFNYDIVVYNEGNVTASNIVVTDYLPCGLTFNAGENNGWTTNAITGNPEITIMQDLPPKQSVTVTLIARAGTCPIGENLDLTNVAEISGGNNPEGEPGDDIDSDPDDNPSNDPPGEDDIDDAPFEFFDLSLEKTSNPVPNATYGSPINYTITVTNEGTIPAVDVTVVDYIPCGLMFLPGSNSTWNFNNTTGNVETAFETTINPGESASLNLILQLVECNNPTSDSFNNKAEISGGNDPDGNPGDDQDSDPDDDPDNDPPGEDDIDDDPLDVYDLTLSKQVQNLQSAYELGDEVTYLISVRNQGNVVANQVQVTDYLPCGTTISQNNSLNWNLVNGNAVHTLNNSLNPGQETQLSLTLVITACNINETGSRMNVAEISSGNDPTGSPGDDIDSTPDSNPDNDPPGEDDIDGESINIVIGSEIGDYVFNDRNGDGRQGNNEQGIPGIKVTLYNQFGLVEEETVTDASGFYTFSEVFAGDYYIVFGDGDIYDYTGANIGNDQLDSDITGAFGEGSTDIFTVIAGVDDYTIDGGLYECALIKGVTYYDINEDDIRQTTENGINGLVVNLYRIENGSKILWESETTHHDYDTPSDDGIWDFCVRPGQYFIEVLLPPIGLVYVRPFVGGANFDSDINNANGPNTTPSFTLQGGGSKTNLGAGFYPMATVGNAVWRDENHNGVQDVGEARVANMVVQLYDENHDMIESTLTNQEGVYTFEYLAKDNYYLKFIPPSEFGFTVSNQTEEAYDSDVTHAMGINTTDMISFNPGEKNTGVDAGIITGALPLEFKSFTARKNGPTNDLSWITSFESNVMLFEIERKINQFDAFEKVGEVKAVGNSTFESSYQFEDEDIADASRYYYRLKQLDNDGKFTYSSVFYLERKGPGSINIFPNPTSNKIEIFTSELNGTYEVKVFNNVGELQMEKSVNFGNINPLIDLTNLSNGIYEVLISQNGIAVEETRIIKID